MKSGSLRTSCEKSVCNIVSQKSIGLAPPNVSRKLYYTYATIKNDIFCIFKSRIFKLESPKKIMIENYFSLCFTLLTILRKKNFFEGKIQACPI